MNWLKRFAVYVLSIVVPIALIGGGIAVYRYFDTKVWIYVDNGGAEPLEANIDGHLLRVAPGTCGLVKLRGGERRLTVEQGGKTIFEQIQTFSNDHPGKWILNPGKTQRYCIQEVRYGINLPQTYTTQYERYMLIAAQIKVVEPAELFKFNGDYVLEAPPKSVSGRFTESRKALRHISAADYAIIAGANTKTDAKEEDCLRLQELVKRILDRAD